MTERILRHTEQLSATHSYLIGIYEGIGDVNFALAASDQIRKHDPSASICILCSELQSEVLQDSTHLDKFVIPYGFYARTQEMTEIRKQFQSGLNNFRFDAFFSPSARYAVYMKNIARSVPIYMDTYKLKYIERFGIPTGQRPQYEAVRNYIDNHLGTKSVNNDVENIKLPIAYEHWVEGASIAGAIKQSTYKPEGRLLLIAPDTSSIVTRPPTQLLADGVAPFLESNEDISVGILPGFTLPESAVHLYDLLHSKYGQRIQFVDGNNRQHLLSTAALIEHSDFFIVGDTGLMHLAVTEKTDPDLRKLHQNHPQIITIWGGTRPGYYGYPVHSNIVGEGHPLQKNYFPGINKNPYANKEMDYFSHVKPVMITDALFYCQ